MKGVFITFEGAEGCGKSTQVELAAKSLRFLGRTVRVFREPGGTTIGEEIRHTLKHSSGNRAMTPEAELLLMNASRAQLVRESIRPCLAAGEIVLCDRFYDSTVAYQGYGRGLDLSFIKSLIDFAVGDTRPALTLMLSVSQEISRDRQAGRQSKLPLTLPVVLDRFEQEKDDFFERVAAGFRAIAAAEPKRVKTIDASPGVDVVSAAIWEQIEALTDGAPQRL